MLTDEQARRIAIKLCLAKNKDPDELIRVPSPEGFSVVKKTPLFILEAERVKDFALMLDLIRDETHSAP